jgi:hypothetical protein
VNGTRLDLACAIALATNIRQFESKAAQKKVTDTRRLRQNFGALLRQFRAAHMADLADTFVDFNWIEQTMPAFDAELVGG